MFERLPDEEYDWFPEEPYAWYSRGDEAFVYTVEDPFSEKDNLFDAASIFKSTNGYWVVIFGNHPYGFLSLNEHFTDPMPAKKMAEAVLRGQPCELKFLKPWEL
jgi:hypothetical protein